MLKRYLAVATALSLLVGMPAQADYVVKDGAGANATFGSFSLNGVQFPKHAFVDPTTGNAIGVLGSPIVVIQQPFRPIPGTTISVTAGQTATGAGKLPLAASGAIPAGTATSYRVRNPAASASPITWILTTDPAKVPVIPTPYAADGTGGTAGDKTMDPGSVEVISLSPAQQAALAAGTLYLSVITPAGGSGVLSVTPGNGA